MEAFYRTHAYLVEHTNAPVRRDLMDEIDWNDRLIGIKGTRGVGKTTFPVAIRQREIRHRPLLPLHQHEQLLLFRSQHRGLRLRISAPRRESVLIDQVFKASPDWSQELRYVLRPLSQI